MVDVRRATLADVDALVAMGRAMHAESPSYSGEPFEPDVLHAWLRERIGGATLLADHSAVFLACRGADVVGVLVAMVVPRWFNRGHIAAELTLYVAPEHRGGRTLPRLVQAYEQWARAHGAMKTTLGVSTGLHAERTVCAYRKLGYKLDGYSATKTL